MNHRQRMLAGNKIQQMIKNESYREFPDMCVMYVARVQDALERKGMRDEYKDMFGRVYLAKEREGGWLHDLCRKFFEKLA